MEFEFSFKKTPYQPGTNSLNRSYIRIFLLTMIPMFVMVMLQHLGLHVPSFHLASPLPQTVDTLSVITPKLKAKENVYTLKKPLPVVPVSYAASDFDQLPAYSVIDFDSGVVIAQKNISKPLPIASLTKIMTAVVALDLASPDDLFTVSKTAQNEEPTKIGVVAGQKMRLSELLHAMLLTSANDAAQVVKDGIDQKYGAEVFVRAMNKKAELLGLRNSHFNNPQGFDNTIHYSSVEDLAILTHYALTKYPLIAEIAKKDYAFLPEDQNHKQFDLYNWNGLLDVYPNVVGLKIGNTQDAGFTTIAVSKRDGKEILAVVLGADTIVHRDLYAAELLDVGYEKTLNLPHVSVTEDQLKEKYSTWKYFN